ncbi:hypothetical protein BHE74_00047212 [Ensete ventricosum]|nr:hypothetical protein BHE74_00047212 [Ensete ventricosum]RZR85413.1 hypothetical protein BHM03_00012388 [Ensete ventricosum]
MFHLILTDIAPICEGAVQHIASKRFQIGGIDLTNLLVRELCKSNPLMNIDISEVEKLKEQHARCAEDQAAFEETLRACPKETHTLPDGQVLPYECYLAVRVLILQLACDHKAQLPQNEQRLTRLLPQVLRSGSKRKLIYALHPFDHHLLRVLCSNPLLFFQPPEYMPENLSKNSAWMGGAILAKVVFPQNQHVTKGDYDETGPAIVHKKCF